jgi:hypothetical protein
VPLHCAAFSSDNKGIFGIKLANHVARATSLFRRRGRTVAISLLVLEYPVPPLDFILAFKICAKNIYNAFLCVMDRRVLAKL